MTPLIEKKGGERNKNDTPNGKDWGTGSKSDTPNGIIGRGRGQEVKMTSLLE